MGSINNWALEAFGEFKLAPAIQAFNNDYHNASGRSFGSIFPGSNQ
jgi:hypothetical protein